MIRLLLALTMLIGLPLLGMSLSPGALGPYFEFPPQTLYVRHAPFSWAAFAAYSLFILVLVTPFVLRGLKSKPSEAPSRPSHRFPWWGWLGLFWGVLAWIVAWTRFPQFEPFQAHTFTPLWIGYIVTINALTFRRKGACLLLQRPVAFLLLFPFSALFWWFFEYLNRFVQNWQYAGVQFDPLAYFLYATLSFSTVLPAFTATREWILTFSWPERKFLSYMPLSAQRPKLVASAVLLFAAFGLAAIGVWPNLLFPLLWMAPLLVIVSLQALSGEHHLFSNLPHGDWQIVVASALAALVCGFFWEMWNFYSLAKWVYHVPFVHRFQVFEMPILGYAGYLPFGLECAVLADIVLKKDKTNPLRNDPDSRIEEIEMNERKEGRVLFICTHNSARSHMAEGFLNARYGDRYEAFSAGTEPSQVNPLAISVMAEVGIDISGHRSKGVEEFLSQNYEYVVTVCDHANETCPFFQGGKKRLHRGFRDPSAHKGSIEERLSLFRQVRDEIMGWIEETFGSH